MNLWNLVLLNCAIDHLEIKQDSVSLNELVESCVIELSR